ncbi:uncharacterized protein LOC9655625 [Selaginella moellendorffii]|uniref:uncharacterized protein LOC9655625 n=1 Tax=Selaginella moellendorffii TaxID=88036 RepID=UPI000D1C390E|nr:uncharacterized protein LOC9655625 [Selaginella moellendorffii]|eukprot:XP_024525031.1 uncharacterized protein LOC9655625 [Selaginella moellendorffii]
MPDPLLESSHQRLAPEVKRSKSFPRSTLSCLGRQHMGEVPRIRRDYEREVAALRVIYEALGTVSEATARKLHNIRSSIKRRYTEISPWQWQQIIKNRQHGRYDTSSGPSFQFLRDQGKSFQSIGESACRPGGKDLNMVMTQVSRRYSYPMETKELEGFRRRVAGRRAAARSRL